MLIVSSLAGAPAAYAAHRPKRVISIISEDDAAPHFAGLAPGAHLRLYVERESSAQTINAAARQRAGEIIGFLKLTDGAAEGTKDGAGGILVHCNRGIARSMAAAYIILCLDAPAGAEPEIARKLRRAAPFADPCPLLVSYADEILGRGGRMTDAIEDLPAPSTVLLAPVVCMPHGV